MFTDYKLVRLPDHHVAAVGAGHRAADQQQIVFRVDAHHFEVAHGAAFVADTGRPCCLPLKTWAGNGVAAGAADVAMHLLHAVRGPLAVEIVPLHDAG